MIIKTLEIRDEDTTMSMLAIKLIPENEAQRAVLRHAGYGTPEDYVILLHAHDLDGSYDPFKQPGWATGIRTRFEAHRYVKKHFDQLVDGDVVDVQYILNERSTKKTSEIQKNYSDAEWKRMRGDE
jgi:hypothetical protein